MLLSVYGRDTVRFPFTANVGDLADPEVLLDGQWHPATIDGSAVLLLVAGPEAEDNPPDAVVLPRGQHWPRIRFTDNPEVLVEDAGVILVV